MSRVFADSFYFFALVNERDHYHSRALAWTQSVPSNPVVTTEWIMLEVADGLAGAPARAAFHELRQTAMEDAANLLIPLDMLLYTAGLDLVRRRADKQWSLTDCMSFTVMEREGLTDALTGDRHFEQAGFRTLFA